MIADHRVERDLNVIKQLGDAFIVTLLPVLQHIPPQNDQLRFGSLLLQYRNRLDQVRVGKRIVYALTRFRGQMKIGNMGYAHLFASA